MTKCLILFFTLFLYTSNYSQSSLINVISEVESKSDYSFNYEKDSLLRFNYNGEIPDRINPEFIEDLLSTTPFDFKITERKEVLIFYVPPKQMILCGSLKDGSNSNVLPFGSIQILGTSKGIEADGNGFFEIKDELVKYQLISFSYLGYKSRQVRVNDFISDVCEDIFLDPDENILSDDVIIKDYILRDISKGKEYGSFKYNYQNFTKRKSSLESDLLRSLQFLPGVSSIDDSATNLNIRGASADHSMVLWENAPLYNPGHMFGMISSINPFVIKSVDLYKDVFHPKYDNRVGSLIDISLSDTPAESFRMGAGVTLTEGHIYLESPIIKDRLSVILSGRNSIYDLYQSQTFESYSQTIFQNTKVQEQEEEIIDGDRIAENQLSYYDVNAKLNFIPFNQLHLSASFFSSRNQYSYFSEEFFDDLSSVDNVDYKVETLSGRATFKWNDSHRTSMSYAKSNTANQLEFMLNESDQNEILAESNGFNDIKDESIDMSHEYVFHDQMRMGVGYTYNVKEVGFSLSEQSEHEDDFSEQDRNRGKFHNAYASIDGKYNRWSINLGGRATKPVNFDQTYFSPRLNIQYEATDGLSFNLTAGRTYQFINQLEEFGGFDLNINGNIWILKDLEEGSVLEAEKLAIGTIYKNKGWLLDISAYRNSISGLSILRSASLGLDPELSQNGKSLSRGIDVLLHKNWLTNKEFAQLNSWVTYSLNENSYSFPEITEESFPAPIHQLHTIKFVNKLNLKKIQFMMSYQYKSGLPYSRPLGIEQLDNDSDDYQIKYDGINGERLDEYHRVDLGLTYLHKADSFNFEFSLSILNVTDRTNIFSRTSFIDEDDDGTLFLLSSERRLLKRTPLLMMRVYW